MARYVLDSYALIAHYDNEEGADIVSDLLSRGARRDVELYLSIVNLGELVYTSERDKGPEQANSRLEDTRRLPITLAGVNEPRVLAAAHIKARYRVSYADAFAIALAQELPATIVTGDPEFANVEKIVAVLWLTEPPKTMEKKTRERRAAYRVRPKRRKVR